MMIDKRILEAMDACRPGSNDLADPELAEFALQIESDPEVAAVFARVQAMDRSLIAAFEDVPVPEGLEARLLACVESSSDVDAAKPQPASTVQPSSTIESSRFSRRAAWSLGAAGALAAALLIGVAVQSWNTDITPVTAEDFEIAAANWYAKLSESPGGWKSLDSIPANYVPSTRIVPMPRSWRRFSCQYDTNAVAVDYTLPGSNDRVTLLAIRAPANVSGWRTTPPRHPTWTLGRTIAAWQEGGMLYVLVVKSDDQDSYHRAVDTTRRPLT